MSIPVSFTAVVLAGGQSSRMGRDKAWLDVQGRPLIRRQCALLQRLKPDALYISAPITKTMQALGWPILPDHYAAQGPLAGIERGLAAMTSPLLLVLAVDMARMSAGILRRLLHHATPQSGIVPVVDGHLEPLAAIYPQCALASARAFLEAGRNSATQFAEWTVHLRLARALPLPASLWPGFANWNSPADLPQGRRWS